jgi:uncharacterized protein (UPF0147 family)
MDGKIGLSNKANESLSILDELSDSPNVQGLADHMSLSYNDVLEQGVAYFLRNTLMLSDGFEVSQWSHTHDIYSSAANNPIEMGRFGMYFSVSVFEDQSDVDTGRFHEAIMGDIEAFPAWVVSARGVCIVDPRDHFVHSDGSSSLAESIFYKVESRRIQSMFGELDSGIRPLLIRDNGFLPIFVSHERLEKIDSILRLNQNRLGKSETGLFGMDSEHAIEYLKLTEGKYYLEELFAEFSLPRNIFKTVNGEKLFPNNGELRTALRAMFARPVSLEDARQLDQKIRTILLANSGRIKGLNVSATPTATP